TCAPPNSRWPPKPQSSSKALQNSSKAPKAPPTVQTPKSTNQALVHLETPNGLQNLKPPPKLFKIPPRLQKRLKEPSK
ncbi:unnamed protein product, partial [Sphagnum compactum]